MTRVLRSRRALAATLTALAVVVPVGAGGAVAPPAAAAEQAAVDPTLVRQAATGAAPAVVAWDRDTATREEVAAHLDRHGIAYRMFSHLPMAIACAGGSADVAALAGVPGARSVWGDEKMTPAIDLGAVRAASGGGIAEIGAAASGFTGDGVGIAVMDTGVDARHDDLTFGEKTKLNARVVLSHLEIMGPGNDTCFVDTYDDGVEDSESVSGHGTHLASVAAGTGAASGGDVKGVAPAADIVGVNVVEHVTPEVEGDVSASLIRFLAGVNYVISRSLDGGPTITKVALLGWTSQGLHDPWHPHSLAIRDLFDFGISVVVPVGNGGSSMSQCDQAATCHFNPLAAGAYPIAVGATPRDARTLESYSSGGDPNLREARDELVRYEPTLVAPGTGILGARRLGLVSAGAPVPGRYPLAGYGGGAGDDPTNVAYQALTGTSVAAAHVAGTVALMQEAALAAKGCFLTPAQVQTVLRETAAPMAGYERWQVGAGFVDADAAVAAAQTATRVASPDPWMCPSGT